MVQSRTVSSCQMASPNVQILASRDCISPQPYAGGTRTTAPASMCMRAAGMSFCSTPEPMGDLCDTMPRPLQHFAIVPVKEKAALICLALPPISRPRHHVGRLHAL